MALHGHSLDLFEIAFGSTTGVGAREKPEEREATIVAVHESVVGTFRKCHPHCAMSALKRLRDIGSAPLLRDAPWSTRKPAYAALGVPSTNVSSEPMVTLMFSLLTLRLRASTE